MACGRCTAPIPAFQPPLDAKFCDQCGFPLGTRVRTGWTRISTLMVWLGALLARAEEAGALVVRVRVAQSQQAGIAHGLAVDRGDGDGGIVDEAVADHFEDVGVGLGVGGGHLCDFPGELFLAGQHGAVGVGLDQVVGHCLVP